MDSGFLKAEPTKEEMHAVIVGILKRVDFNTTRLSDILKLLSSHFRMDLMDRKAEVMHIITVVMNNMSAAEAEEEDMGTEYLVRSVGQTKEDDDEVQVLPPSSSQPKRRRYEDVPEANGDGGSEEGKENVMEVLEEVGSPENEEEKVEEKEDEKVEETEKKSKRARSGSVNKDHSASKKQGRESAEKKLNQNLVEEKKELVTPAVEQPTRERKVVERYFASSTGRSSASKALLIEKGCGMQLKDIPNMAFKLAKRKPDDNLQLLHTVFFDEFDDEFDDKFDDDDEEFDHGHGQHLQTNKKMSMMGNGNGPQGPYGKMLPMGSIHGLSYGPNGTKNMHPTVDVTKGGCLFGFGKNSKKGAAEATKQLKGSSLKGRLLKRGGAC